VTKLGRLVKAGKIQSMEQIYLHSLPIKEYQIVDWFLPKLKDEVMKVRNEAVLGPLHENDINATLSYRSSRFKSKLAPVNVLDSRPSSSSETPKDTSGWASRRQKK
jgi:hypothetical protein